jgi:hypothetical protein
MEKERFTGPKGKNLRVIGKTANNKAKELFIILMGARRRVFGKKDKE